MAAIFYVSSLSNLTALPGDVSDKTAHFAAYFVLSIFVLYGRASGRWAGVSVSSAVWAVAFTTVYGASDEFHQRFVPGRSPAWDDLVADFAGAAVGALMALGWHRVRSLRRRTRDV